jgi:hypothetical protein
MERGASTLEGLGLPVFLFLNFPKKSLEAVL